MAKTKRADLQLEEAFLNSELPTYEDGENQNPDDDAAEEEINVIEAADDDEGETQGEGEGERSAEKPADNDEGEAGEEDAFLALQRSYDELKAEAEKRKQESAAFRAQADEAARVAAQYRQEAEQSQAEARRASQEAINDAISHAQSNITVLKNESMRAANEQDWDSFAEAQAALVENTAHLQQLNKAKASAEGAQGESPREQTPPSSGSSSDDVEGFIRSLSPRSQEWVRANKDDIFSSVAKRNKAQAAHVMAVADGYAVDSDDYFKELDKYMGYQSDAAKKSAAPKIEKEKERVASAPPARVNPAQKTTRDVKLTKEQQETAVAIFSDKSRADALALYAKGLREINSGKTHLKFSGAYYDGGYNGN
jgi:hypothetical protein